MITNEERRELVSVYNTSRDFCGNPRQAVRQWEAENRELTDEEYLEVLDAANLAWEESKPL
jgi:hypothetical protein